jgi:hypothetical protein
MFKYTVTTTRPNKNAAFFPNTANGATYDSLMNSARGVRPTSGPDGVVGYSRVESPDGLTLTTEWSFVSPAGKDALMAEFDTRRTANGMIPVVEARNAYNSSVGHSTAVTFSEVV